MGPSSGAAFLEVSCGSAVKKVLLSNDGEAPPQNKQNPPNSPSLNPPPPAAQNSPGTAGLAGTAPANSQQPAPAPEDDSAIRQQRLVDRWRRVALGVVGAVALAVGLSGSSSSSGSTCNSGSRTEVLRPLNASVWLPGWDHHLPHQQQHLHQPDLG